MSSTEKNIFLFHELTPFKFTGAFESLDSKYFIGSIVSESTGIIIANISLNGVNASKEKVNQIGVLLTKILNDLER